MPAPAKLFLMFGFMYGFASAADVTDDTSAVLIGLSGYAAFRIGELALESIFVLRDSIE